MSRELRARALRSAGKQPRVLPQPSAARGAEDASGNSRSDEVAANSENSALASTSSATASMDLSGYAWYEEYVELTRRFPWRLAAYIAWAASPVMGRLPATQFELAQALGLKTDRTIRQWKEKDATIDQVIADLQAAPLWRHRRDLYEALVKAAVDGDVPALKLAFEMTGIIPHA